MKRNLVFWGVIFTNWIFPRLENKYAFDAKIDILATNLINPGQFCLPNAKIVDLVLIYFGLQKFAMHRKL